MINRGEVKEDRNRGREDSALLNGSAVREMRKKIGKKNRRRIKEENRNARSRVGEAAQRERKKKRESG